MQISILSIRISSLPEMRTFEISRHLQRRRRRKDWQSHTHVSVILFAALNYFRYILSIYFESTPEI